MDFSTDRAAERSALLSCAYGLMTMQPRKIFRRAIEAVR